MRQVSRLLWVVSMCVVFAASVFAETDRGTITGTVADSTKAVIPGANVTATNTETTSKYETISTETGNYTLTQLPVGTYQLTVELPGFKKPGADRSPRCQRQGLRRFQVHQYSRRSVDSGFTAGSDCRPHHILKEIADFSFLPVDTSETRS
jgi:hypothetical protein